MEGVDAADLAEVVPGDLQVPLVERQVVLAGQDLQLGVMHLGHDRVPAPAQRTVAARRLMDFGGDAETHRAAVAGTVPGPLDTHQ
jgi:poly-gamma-glutamate capsule biosynthesis protein CapA/YwtB (metallophosphatase superfamily)